MAEEQQVGDQPSLELPSLFKRRRKAVQPERPGQSSPSSRDVPAPTATPVQEAAPGAAVDRPPRRQVSLPSVGALPAAVVTGAVVGLLAVGLTWLGLRGCSAIRDTSSCGEPGFLLLLAIVVLMAASGRALLRAWRVSDPGSTSILASALMAVLTMLFLMGSLEDTWTVVLLPVLGAVAFALAQWVTSTNTTPGDRIR
jgi:hypothetical protein